VAEANSQTDRVVFALREMLLRGKFRPGERVAELTLVPLLNASRTPVRLALQRLAHEGLLEAVSTRGFRVRAFTISDIWDAIEIRGVLEGTAARLAAERLASPGELAGLRSSCTELEQLQPMTLKTFVGYLEANDRFHRELWRLAKSQALTRMIESAIALPFAAPSALLFGHMESAERATIGAIALEHHRSMIEAIQNREGTRAENLAREHSRVARRTLEGALRDGELFRRIPGASLITMPPAS
jgi:GntR family transcriptional regulator, vanillate catabolism transcriptional regulator